MNSPVVTSAEMRAAENAAFARDASAESLMDKAGAGIASAVRQFFPRAGECILFAGKGNNGGDALVAAGHLQRLGWRVEVRLAFPKEECGDLLRKKLIEFRDSDQKVVARAATQGREPLIILDGLLGLGSKPPLREPLLASCREINRLRRENHAFVFAVDLPSGLDGDTGITDTDCVLADFTVTIGAAKRGLVADGAIDHVGRLEIVSLPELQLTESNETISCRQMLNGLLPRRAFNAYKNQFGRIGIVAGSRGLVGASILCGEGALRSGAGLVRVFVLEDIYSIVAAAAPAEAMIQPLESYRDLQDESVAVWAIGPGLGQSRMDEMIPFIQRAEQPMVIDADGLNILSHDMTILKHCAGPRLLTPHPGEMKRLTCNATLQSPASSTTAATAGSTAELSRADIARQFTREFPVTLLLKGSRTIVAERGEYLSYNVTGNPGMATGGMGDVLTGVCAALLGQKLNPFDAARLGSWVCGRAAEIAIFSGAASEQSLLPRDVIANLGTAFKELQAAG